MKFTNNTYDILKKICLYVLPALATLVIALGEIWQIGKAPLIAATITAVNAFIGTCLGISSENYYQEKQTAEERKPNSMERQD